MRNTRSEYARRAVPFATAVALVACAIALAGVVGALQPAAALADEGQGILADPVMLDESGAAAVGAADGDAVAEGAAAETDAAEFAAADETAEADAADADTGLDVDAAEAADVVDAELDVEYHITYLHTDYLQRLAGANRYGTMVQIVTKSFFRSDTAIVVSGENFPDALCASSLAGIHDAPVLLTSAASLSDETKAELTRLEVKKVIIVGGKSAVSAKCASQIEKLGISVSRVSGNTRQETADAAMALVAKEGGSAPTSVIIANGEKFADSLSVSPYAFAKGVPILLTNGDQMLNQGTVKAIKELGSVKKVIIVGGTSVVSDSVKSQLGSGYSYTRLAGANRYETSEKIARWEMDNGLSCKSIALATGENFPDALAGSALAGKEKGLILLVSPGYTSNAKPLVTSKAVNNIILLGGKNALGGDVVENLTRGTYGFYTWLGDYGKNALAVYDNPGSKLKSYTKLGAKGDATDLASVENAVYWIRTCNMLRTQEAKDPESGAPLGMLMISPELMAISNVQTNWSSDNLNHSMVYNVGENLAWGYDNPFEGWYHVEKATYQKTHKSDGSTGHYLNIVNGSYQVTGFSVCESSQFGITHGQTFSYGVPDDAMDVNYFYSYYRKYKQTVYGE